MNENRPCGRCKGEGTTFSKGFTSLEGKVYPDKTEVCYSCNGAKEFSAPNGSAILDIITTSRGMKDGKRKIRAAWPSKLDHYKDRELGRAYFVWRLARFHGGKDVTMPCTADMVVRSDPFKPELNAMAEQVAKHCFGTDMAAAMRWGSAFGLDVPSIPGLPATAYPCGPVKSE